MCTAINRASVLKHSKPCFDEMHTPSHSQLTCMHISNICICKKFYEHKTFYCAFCTHCNIVFLCEFQSCSTLTSLLSQSVLTCLVPTLSFPLCLYHLWLSSSAQLADKIRACSACPVFPKYYIPSLFSPLPHSKAREKHAHEPCVMMKVFMHTYVHVCGRTA